MIGVVGLRTGNLGTAYRVRGGEEGAQFTLAMYPSASNLRTPDSLLLTLHVPTLAMLLSTAWLTAGHTSSH